MNKQIFWLASYPKSGNTWFRIFLANLLATPERPFDLNHLRTGPIASSREWIDNALGFDSAHLTHDEIDQLRPRVYQEYGETEKERHYLKIHDAYTYLNPDVPLIPREGCAGALYFVRNPLDVAISFANHLSCSIDQAIKHMANPHFAFCDSPLRQFNQLRQKLLSWSLHVKSWTEATEVNVLVIRYEDMKLHSQETFTQASHFLRLDKTSNAIETAIQESAISKLQQLEASAGFREKPSKVKQFFRKGMVGDWQTTLSTAQIERIIDDHGEIMQRFGYVDKEGRPVRAN